MGLKESVDQLTQTIKEKEEKRMIKKLEKWFRKFMSDEPLTPEQIDKQLQISERIVMGLACL